MYNFEKDLFVDEKILYQGQAVPGKGAKGVGGPLLLIGFCLGIIILLIIGIIKQQSIEMSAIIIFFVISLFLILGGWTLIYNLFFKKKKLIDVFYCVTNFRVMRYEGKTNKLVYGSLTSYEEIKTYNIKDNYGDLSMMMHYQENDGETPYQTIENLGKMMANPDSTNMVEIRFESIEEPQRVAQIVINAKNELLKRTNNN